MSNEREGVTDMATRVARLVHRFLPREAGLDEAAFVRLYTHHLEPVFNYVRYRLGPAETEDVTADIFARAWSRRRDYDPRKGSPEAWLWGIARNTVMDRLHSRRPVHVPLSPELKTGSDPAAVVEERQMWQQLQAALTRLPAVDQEIIALRFGAGYTNRAIAEMLELSEANVAQRLQRALRKLRMHIEGGESQ